MQEGSSDQIFSASFNVYAVTVAVSLRKAFEIPYLLLMATFDIR
jgi:hypothetical protein